MGTDLFLQCGNIPLILSQCPGLEHTPHDLTTARLGQGLYEYDEFGLCNGSNLSLDMFFQLCHQLSEPLIPVARITLA